MQTGSQVPSGQAPLLAVSTIKDSPDHVRRYVEGNLAGGVDHLVVFLDAPSDDEQDEVLALLSEHPRVSVVRAGAQTGWLDQTRVKRSPAAARASKCGVCATGSP